MTTTGEVTLNTLRYNSEGNVLTAIDANTLATTNSYDVLGRLIMTSDPLGNTTGLLPDKAGNVIETTDANTNATTQTYSTLNRLKTVTQNDGTRAITTRYTYDAAGSVRTVTDAEGRVTTHTYDGAGRLLSIQSPLGQTAQFAYDDNGNIIRRTDQNGQLTEYAYDAYNQLTQVYYGGQAAPVKTITFTYDNTGNRLTMTETSGTHNYNYDNIYRLTGAAHPASSTETYTYDRVGNRLTDAANPDWTYDANNRLQSYDGITFTHDNNGNTTSKDEGATLTTYSYDEENRLTTATPNSLTVTYGYDPFGKRLSKTIGGATTYYLYDEEDIIGEYDTTGALTASYIHGQGIDEPISMTRGGQTYYYTFDGLGSVRDLTDSIGNIVEQYQYDSFGNLTAPPTTGNRYTYTAREYDAETGLYFYRARYYDSSTGRFLAEDPIGFEGGDVNFYAYVFNNPLNWVDPEGLSSVLFGRPWWMFRVGPRGPVNYHRPPTWNPNWEWRYPAGRTKPNVGPRWFDPKGGEWRWHAPDKYHPKGHWDYNPWDQWNIPWQNIEPIVVPPLVDPNSPNNGNEDSCTEESPPPIDLEECIAAGLCA